MTYNCSILLKLQIKKSSEWYIVQQVKCNKGTPNKLNTDMKNCEECPQKIL